MAAESHDPSRARIRLGWRAIVGFFAYASFSAVALFAAAGTLRWPMAWLYVGLSLAVTLVSRLIVLRINPDLLEERGRFTKGEGVEGWDRWLMPLVGLVGPISLAMVAGLDHRLGWSRALPAALPWIGCAFLVLGYAWATWALATNRFFSAVVRIQSERGHTVVDTGPYRWMRHPGYAGGLVSYCAAPLLLNALWAFIPAGLTAIALIVRTALEDRALQRDLPGYPEYARRVRGRLLPGVW
jgi:protein-S-isoprenylcysteine O-methyltransferase Ste14